MLERTILIVDDNIRTKDIYIPLYSTQIDKLKQASTKWSSYTFVLIHMKSMHDALEYLHDVKKSVDVLVVDYDFNGERAFTNGASFVKYVRENVNRYCQIVFYTMQGLNSIDKSELVDLINSDVFKIIDKSSSPDLMSSALFEAATMRNPIVESLEHFYQKYHSILNSYKYAIDGQNLSFEDIIMHIRLDDNVGRLFVEKLLQKAIITDIDI